MIEDTIYTLLSAVGTVFPKVAKQTQDAPYMVYTVVSSVPSKRKNGVSITDIMRLQIDVYGPTAKAVYTLYESLRTALDYTSSGSITHISYDSHQDFFDESADYYRRSVDFLIRIKR